MAYGRQAFSTQEAVNAADAYKSYKCEILTLDGTNVQNGADWAALGQPAKEVLLYTASNVADDDGVTIELNIDGSWGNEIVIGHDNLPFTIKGLLINQIRLTGGSGDADAITVLSFH